MKSLHTPNTVSLSTEDDVERLVFSLNSLGEIGHLFTSDADFQKIAEAALQAIIGSVGVSQVALLVFDKENHSLQCVVAQGIRKHSFSIEVNEDLQSLLVRTKEPLVLDREAVRAKPLQSCAGSIRRLDAHLWVPLIMQGELLGVLSLGPEISGNAYGDDGLRVLGAIGQHFSVGLYNQRLMGEVKETNFQLNRRVVELEMLYDAGLTLSLSLQAEDVVEEILLLTVGVVDARGGFLVLKDGRTGRFALVHQIGLSETQCEILSEPSIRRRMGRVMRSHKPLHLGREQMPVGLGVEHAVIAPVGEVGFLAVVDKESRQGVQAFSESDAHLLELMGQQAGAALANARLYKSILEVKNYNQNILSSIGNGVISTDLKGRIVQANPSVERIFGGDEKLLGRSCARFFRRCGCQNIAEAVEASLRDGEDRQVEGEQVADSDVTLDVRITALRNERDEIQGVVIALEDLTQEMRIRTMFKQYASDQVVDKLMSEKTPPTLGGEEREVTILFVDTRGSTALLGRIGADEMVNLLNDCFSCLNEVVFQYSGTLYQYTGDGCLVVYGAPLALPDDSERAVQTALAMREEMVRFNKNRSNPLPLAYGISRGRVVAGNIGSIRRMEYTVIGPAVVLASRFCDNARAGQIWVGPNVHKELKGRFEFSYLGPHRFKGVEPVDVYEVLGSKGARRRSRRQKKDVRPMPHKPKKGERKIDLTIPMVPEMELAATRTAEAVAEFMRMEKDQIEEIKLALIEACINAFEHSQSEDRRVAIDFDIGEEELTIRIKDKGQGFDPGKARKEVVRRRKKGTSRRGWGLKIMEELMDRVEIHSDEQGTVITMVKSR